MPDGLFDKVRRQHILDAAARLDGGATTKFGAATEYEAVVGGRSYHPKELLGVALGLVLHREVLPGEFSGGSGATQANGVLRRLGFEVRSIQNLVGEDWTDDEIRATVESYFEMFAKQQREEPFVKAEFIRGLVSRVHGRSAKSVEFKFQNISAVLDEMGLPWLQGFKPKSNYQKSKLPQMVAELLEMPGAELGVVELSVTQIPLGEPPALDEIVVPPPDPMPHKFPTGASSPVPRRLNHAARDDANRVLGRAGEEYVLKLERAKLSRAGRNDLAEKVRWVADLDGDGLGFDILSFGLDGRELHIEVKTTAGGKGVPFHITPSEIAASARNPDCSRLYRLFQFGEKTRLYILEGNLNQQLTLEPVVFRARVGGNSPPAT